MVTQAREAALAAPPQHKDFSRNHSGLRSPGLLGRYPIIGIIMVVLGSGLFAVIAIDFLTQGPLTQTDNLIVNPLHAYALSSSPLIMIPMMFGFYFAEFGFIVIGAGLLVYFLHKRFWTEFSMVLIAWGGEGPLWYFLSGYFNRPRPVFDVPAWHYLTSPGFPSGHSLAAVMCLGFLAYLVVPKIHSYFWKSMVVGLTLLIILYVGFSRLFVGDHYPTDVLAGYAVGLAWAGLVYTVVERFAKKRNERQQPPAQTTFSDWKRSE